MDREVIRIFAQSMVTYPPGTFVLSKQLTEVLLLAGSTMFSTGLRLALPIVAAMLMVDISLALLGRINSQLQLQSLTYPMKMVISLVLLAWLVTLFPALMRGGSAMALNAARTIITRTH
jgi:flagellar biosynthetic protein FliR